MCIISATTYIRRRNRHINSNGNFSGHSTRYVKVRVSRPHTAHIAPTPTLSRHDGTHPQPKSLFLLANSSPCAYHTYVAMWAGAAAFGRRFVCRVFGESKDASVHSKKRRRGRRRAGSKIVNFCGCYVQEYCVSSTVQQ